MLLCTTFEPKGVAQHETRYPVSDLPFYCLTVRLPLIACSDYLTARLCQLGNVHLDYSICPCYTLVYPAVALGQFVLLTGGSQWSSTYSALISLAIGLWC